MDVEIFEDPGQLASAAADFIAEVLEGTEGPCDIGLAGGSTPQATYAELRTRRIDWASVDIWLSDERWVPRDSDDSNGHQAAMALVDHIPRAGFLRPRFSAHLEPDDSAAFYEAQLRSVVWDRPRLVLLGMGTDGHTASLFPGTSALNTETGRWFVANHVPQLNTWRLTVTPHLLDVAERIVVLVAGSAKAEVLAEAIKRPQGRFPIEILHQSNAAVTVFADQAAAGAL
jgi:6-phosphogluconolactonase